MDQPLSSAGSHENRPARSVQFDGNRRVETDEGLRAALERLVSSDAFRGEKDWEAIGAQVLALAERDARRWKHNAAEYASAFTIAAVEFLRVQPDAVLQARSPWGVLVARGRYAAKHAVAQLGSGGLTGRDAVSHRLPASDGPKVCSLEALAEQGESEW